MVFCPTFQARRDGLGLVGTGGGVQSSVESALARPDVQPNLAPFSTSTNWDFFSWWRSWNKDLTIEDPVDAEGPALKPSEAGEADAALKRIVTIAAMAVLAVLVLKRL